MTHGGRPRRFAGPIRARPAAGRSEISQAWSSGGGAPPRPARVHGGWPESPPLVQNFSARKWSKRPYGVFTIWRGLPRVLEFKMVLWGLGFHLAPKVMFIWGLGSLSGKNLKTVWTLLKHCC